MADRVGKLIVVKGKVQGVFFRASTLEQANSLGLTGTVRNLSNGDVEIEAFGSHEKINLLIEWARKGSQLSAVKEVNVREIDFRETGLFQIRY